MNFVKTQKRAKRKAKREALRKKKKMLKKQAKKRYNEYITIAKEAGLTNNEANLLVQTCIAKGIKPQDLLNDSERTNEA